MKSILIAALAATVLTRLPVQASDPPRPTATGVSEPAPIAPKPIFLFEEAITPEARTAMEAAGGQKYFIIYQNNVDPSAQKLGVIDASALGQGIIQACGDTPSGWGVLDFEDPFFSILQDGPSNPKYAAAVDSMAQAIRSVRRVFPKVKWTYYGLPLLRYYVDGRSWSSLSEEVKARETERQISAVSPILAECDWLAPMIYNMVGDGKGSRIASDDIRKCTQEWSESLIRMTVKYAQSRPVPPRVIPFVAPLYQEGGQARTCSVIPMNVFLEDTVKPARRGGAGGLCFWLGASNLIKLAAKDPKKQEIATVIEHWAQDNAVPVEAFYGDNGTRRITALLAEAQSAALKQAASSWMLSSGTSP